MTTTYHVDADAFLLTNEGPRLARDINARDRVAIVGRDGGIRLVHVDEAEATRASGWRVLTEAGDVLVTDRSAIVTSRGPRTGRELATMLDDGKHVRVEVVRNLPRECRAASVPLRDVLLGAIALLPTYMIIVPAAEDSQALSEDVDFALRSAGIGFSTHADDRWCVFVVERSVARRKLVVTRHREGTDALFAITGWLPSGVSRTRIDDVALRAGVAAQLVATGEPFRVDYLPGYYPVEVHVTRLADAQAPTLPYASLKGLRPATAAATAISMASDGFIVASLHLLTSA